MRTALLLIVLLLASAPAQAANLYVNNSGTPACSDSTAKASNSEATPWCTIGRAAWGQATRPDPMPGSSQAEAAAAGDTVYITPGTYDFTWSPGSGPLTSILYSPVNDGTSGNPIRFRSSTGARCSIVITNGGTGGPYIGGDDADYVEWSDFSLTESTAPTIPDTGPAVFFGADHSAMENSCFTGNPNWTARTGDNYNAIRVQSVDGITIRNNTCTDYGGDTNDENHSCVTTYTVKNIVVENNASYNNGTFFYQKGIDNTTNPTYTGSFITRYNYIEGGSQGIRILYVPSTDADPNLVYQNIIKDCAYSGIMLQNTSSEPATARYAIVANNTISGCPIGFEMGGAPLENVGHQFWNNIIVAPGSGDRIALFANHTSYTPTFVDFENNLYYNYSIFLDKADPNLTFANWQALSQDSTGSTSDPLFVSSTDFHLQGGSPAASLGRVTRSIGGTNGATIPAGAYITGTETIGLIDDGSAAKMPFSLRLRGAHD